MSTAAHTISVTGGGPFGRAWLDCSCGLARRFASKRAATIAGVHHRAASSQSPTTDPTQETPR